MKPKIKIFFDYTINTLEDRVNNFIENNIQINNVIDIKYNIVHNTNVNHNPILHYITLIYN